MKKLYVFTVKDKTGMGYFNGLTEDGEEVKTNIMKNSAGFDVEFVPKITEHAGFEKAYQKHCALERSRSHGM